jgi:hypothetical protein
MGLRKDVRESIIRNTKHNKVRSVRLKDKIDITPNKRFKVLTIEILIPNE